MGKIPGKKMESLVMNRWQFPMVTVLLLSLCSGCQHQEGVTLNIVSARIGEKTFTGEPLLFKKVASGVIKEDGEKYLVFHCKYLSQARLCKASYAYDLVVIMPFLARKDRSQKYVTKSWIRALLFAPNTLSMLPDPCTTECWLDANGQIAYSPAGKGFQTITLYERVQANGINYIYEGETDPVGWQAIEKPVIIPDDEFRGKFEEGMIGVKLTVPIKPFGGSVARSILMRSGLTIKGEHLMLIETGGQIVPTGNSIQP